MVLSIRLPLSCKWLLIEKWLWLAELFTRWWHGRVTWTTEVDDDLCVQQVCRPQCVEHFNLRPSRRSYLNYLRLRQMLYHILYGLFIIKIRVVHWMSFGRPTPTISPFLMMTNHIDLGRYRYTCSIYISTQDAVCIFKAEKNEVKICIYDMILLNTSCILK